MIQFHETQLGHRFFNGQLPNLINNLGRIATALEKNGDIQEKRLLKLVVDDMSSSKQMSVNEQIIYFDSIGFSLDDIVSLGYSDNEIKIALCKNN